MHTLDPDTPAGMMHDGLGTRLDLKGQFCVTADTGTSVGVVFPYVRSSKADHAEQAKSRVLLSPV